MSDLYRITDTDDLEFNNGVFYVNAKPFHVRRIDGDLPDGPIVGISGRNILTEFRCFTNEWNAALVEGCFFSDKLARLEHQVRCVEDCLNSWEGTPEEALRYVVTALRNLVLKLVENEQK